MTVTSLATLKLLPDIKPTDPALRDVLLKAVQVMETRSNELAADVLTNFPTHNSTHIPDSEIPQPPKQTSAHKFHVYSQHEDPSTLYILGSWPSRALHMNSFITTDANRSIVASLKPFVAFASSSVHHISLDPALIPTTAPILVIRHHAISPMNLASFEESMEAASLHLAHVSQRPIASGWQIEKAEGGGAQGSRPDDLGDGSEMFVLFSGWDDLGHHKEFQDSGRGEEYEKVREWIDEGGLEVRHAMRVELE
jgi:hypothetical protein